MRASKKLFFFLVVGFCMISLNAYAANASNQICFSLVNPSLNGGNPFILKLGFMDYGNNHFALAGTDSQSFGGPVSGGLVNGNADLINGKVQVSLNGTSMGDQFGYSASPYFYHFLLDPATLSGTYYTQATDNVTTEPNGGITTTGFTGPVSLVSCPD